MGKSTSKSIDFLSEKPTVLIGLRVSPSLDKAVIEKAESLNMDKSKYIRKIVVEDLERK